MKTKQLVFTVLSLFASTLPSISLASTGEKPRCSFYGFSRDARPHSERVYRADSVDVVSFEDCMDKGLQIYKDLQAKNLYFLRYQYSEKGAEAGTSYHLTGKIEQAEISPAGCEYYAGHREGIAENSKFYGISGSAPNATIQGCFDHMRDLYGSKGDSDVREIFFTLNAGAARVYGSGFKFIPKN